MLMPPPWLVDTTLNTWEDKLRLEKDKLDKPCDNCLKALLEAGFYDEISCYKVCERFKK